MILEELNRNKRLEVYTTQALCIYSKDNNSYSECWDNNTNSNLDLDNIDDSYCLDIVDSGNRIDVYIPRNSKCILKPASSINADCIICYKNIECELTFEDEPIEIYFEILE